MPTIQIASGHAHARSAGAYIDAWGSGPLLIRDGKRKWFFEFSEMFGPVLLKREGAHFEPATRQPVEHHHPFWWPFNRWLHGGRKCRPIRTKRGRLAFYLCHVPPAGLR